jgi:oligopeptide/dipeptide ABC transporter ATP-binding protein
MTASALLQVEDLKVHFPGRGRGAPAMRALDGVTLTVGAGEIVGVVGESGCGKTTLGRAIVGLVRPTAGAIRFDGEVLDAPGRPRRLADRRRMQIVFQDPASSLNPVLTVGETIGEALVIHRIGDARDRPGRIATLLDQVGLPRGAAARHPRELSGGQRQRVGIARALAVGPDLIVADEAVSALDVSVQAQIINLLADLRETLGLALLFIGHDLSVIEALCDRVVVLYLGQVMETASAAALFRKPGHPYTRALLDASPRPDPAARGRPRMLLTGDPPSPLSPPSGCVFRTRCSHAAPDCAAARPALEALGADQSVACIRRTEVAA